MPLSVVCPTHRCNYLIKLLRQNSMRKTWCLKFLPQAARAHALCQFPGVRR
jgi:hypothetical protein